MSSRKEKRSSLERRALGHRATMDLGSLSITRGVVVVNGEVKVSYGEGPRVRRTVHWCDARFSNINVHMRTHYRL